MSTKANTTDELFLVSKEFLTESFAQRVMLLERLGVQNVEETEYRLRLLVNQCLADIEDACRDLPDPTRYVRSRNVSHVKTPSQELKFLEAELEELLRWFGGGRRPRLRRFVSRYAMSAMLGRPPFGRHLLALTRYEISKSGAPAETQTSVDAGGDGDGLPRKYEVRRKTVYFVDLLSADEKIQAAQLELYSNTRTEAGDPLVFEVYRFAADWPATFVDLARRCLDDGSEHVRLADLEAGLSKDDFSRMAVGTEHALRIVRHLRGESRATIAKWSGGEPGFSLISEMLDELCQPGEIERLAADKSRQSQERLQTLDDLALALVDLAQEQLNVEREFRKPNFAHVRKPNHFLGKRGRDSVGDIRSLITKLRVEFTAYTIARDTIDAICDAALGRTSQELNSEAGLVCGAILPRLDNRIAARRQFLGFGADHLRAKNFKWCGFLDPDRRQRWDKEVELAVLAVASANRSKTRHLELYADLIQSLELGADVLQAWSALSEWAAGEGRDVWQIANAAVAGGVAGETILSFGGKDGLPDEVEDQAPPSIEN